MEWIDLKEYWPTIERLSNERHQQKKNYKTALHYSKHVTHIVGLAGEFTVSAMCDRYVDHRLLVAGDGGVDFTSDGKTIDVKASRYWREPHLRQFTNPKHWADYYILVGVDVDNKRGRVAGHCTKEMLKAAPKFNYGHGSRLSMHPNQLVPGLPPNM
jgi:hypothetical protein|tara:strand:+ start:316 stop:786 length:471 start_codon:yes stop_codon:yes gene_type:complete